MVLPDRTDYSAILAYDLCEDPYTQVFESQTDDYQPQGTDNAKQMANPGIIITIAVFGVILLLLCCLTPICYCACKKAGLCKAKPDRRGSYTDKSSEATKPGRKLSKKEKAKLERQ